MQTRRGVWQSGGALAGACCAIAVAASLASGATFLVRPDGSGDLPTIQDAVDAASDGDEIVLGDGRFRGHGNWGIRVEEKALTIRSESGNPADCTIDCERVNHGFEFILLWDRVAVLEGITVIRGGGDGAQLGGAVMCWFSSMILRHCEFRESDVAEGGALYIDRSPSTIERCVIADNVATQYPGGGIIAIESPVHLVDCTIVHNADVLTAKGGGISCQSSYVTLERTIVSDNWSGKAIYCDETSTVVLTRSNIFGNAGGDWVGCIAGQETLDGNFSADPLFCDPDAGVYTLRPDSPCAAPGLTGQGLIGALPVGCDVPGQPVVPVARALGNPFPNPSRGAVQVRLEVPPGGVGAYQMEIFDVSGRLVFGRLVEVPAPDSYDLQWDGTDGVGHTTGAGVYFFALNGPGFRELRKVVRVP